MLKKKQRVLVAASMAAAAFASAASAVETTGAVYGDLRLSLGRFDSSGPGATDAHMNVDNNNSHIGLRASLKDNGITAFMQYERLADNDSGTPTGEFTRQFFGGVNTEYGGLIVGRAPTAYKRAGQKLDPFYNTSVAGTAGSALVANGASYGLSALNNDSPGSGFINNTIAYSSPSFFGVTGNVAVFVDDGSSGQHHDYAAGAEYSADGITGGVQYLSIKSGTTTGSVQNFNNIGLGTGAGLPAATGEVQALRGYGAYAAPKWGVGASYENLALKNDLPTAKYAFVSGWCSVTDRLGFAVTVGNTKDTAFEGTGYTVGAFYDVIKDLTAYSAFRYVNRKDTNAGSNASDTQTIAVGLSYKFDLSIK